jgi:hypothetical protein
VAGSPLKPADTKRMVAGGLASPDCPWISSGTCCLLPRKGAGWAILSLNVNRMPSLGGLASIVRSVKPDIIFL